MIFPGLFGMSRRENETVNLVFVILEAESDGGSSVLKERLTRTVCWPMAAQRCRRTEARFMTLATCSDSLTSLWNIGSDGG